ncbi:helix-turn-helix domain-containing protein [Limnovirga soli]|uniref:Helix-turn-helix domain-containing protein n=1 Tax=Limnovirga soli TaxID=2656915 RepID=A0A8J8FC44_9BACT|nr:helix-turn-helix transcriptional regulator [Limnovirga soli]NNV53962.1 helix-turn-helix domain-containing protein [Limnovirga soli]
MLVLNIKNLCRLRGIPHPQKALIQAGISDKVATQYLKGNKSTILLAHIEILCKLLNCRPDNLFAWQPDTPADDQPNHPLQGIRIRPLANALHHLQQMTVEEAEALLRSREM